MLLESINSKFDMFIEKLENLLDGRKEKPNNLKELTVTSLLTLPKPLQETSMQLMEMEKATAEELAEKTGLQRAVESAHLNQLVRLGYVKKERIGRIIYFSILQ